MDRVTHRPGRLVKAAIFILWPSFIVGGIGEVLFFTVFDPKELYLFGEPTSWAFAAAASAFTWFLSRGVQT